MDEYDENEPTFSLNDFKKWMSKQPDKPKNNLIGLQIESKLSAKRLMKKIIVKDGEIEDLAQEFKEDGGTILEVGEDHHFLVEVESGSFFIPRYFVRRR